MPNYFTPGVYIEEIPTGPRPIQPVGTSTAAFVGQAPKAEAHLRKAVAVNNWSQFVKEFVPDVKPGEKVNSTSLSHAVAGFFQNGGRRCFIVNVKAGENIAGGDR